MSKTALPKLSEPIRGARRRGSDRARRRRPLGSKRFAKEISGLKMKLYDRDADAAGGGD